MTTRGQSFSVPSTSPEGGWLPIARQVVDTCTYHPGPVGGYMLDLFTASTLVQVHDALNPANRARLAAMPLPVAADLAFRLAAKVSR